MTTKFVKIGILYHMFSDFSINKLYSYFLVYNNMSNNKKMEGALHPLQWISAILCEIFYKPPVLALDVRERTRDSDL